MLKGLLKRLDRLGQKIAMIAGGMRGLGLTSARTSAREASRRLPGWAESIEARQAEVVPATIAVRIDD